MREFIFEAVDERGTDRFGAALAGALPDGTTVALCGTLGAGKTRLVQAIASACGVPREDVVSPTFVLCQQYEGRRTIYHLDAYRVKDQDEFRELGIEELCASAALIIIEWADRVADVLPDDHVRVDVDVMGPTIRRFVVRPIGIRSEDCVAKLAVAP